MSQMRFNPVTRDWVILAEERAGKPYEFDDSRSPRHSGERREDCPFCPGNEDQTTEEISRVGHPGGDWEIRVVFNKFPALRPGVEINRKSEGTFLSMQAAGHHEVVIDHPRHDMELALTGTEHLAKLIRVYRDRYAALRALDYIRNITLFRNHGLRAGTSLEHPHSQIVGAPIVPPQVRLRMQDATRYHDEKGECLFCQVIADEREAGERIIEDSDHFTGFVPFSALSPFHQWIFPRRHAASFDTITESEIDDLARVLGRMMIRMREGIGDPDFNLSIRSSPTGAADVPYYHWYIAIVPRVSRLAGFEMGSGIYINPLAPERAAELLRQVEIPD